MQSRNYVSFLCIFLKIALNSMSVFLCQALTCFRVVCCNISTVIMHGCMGEFIALHISCGDAHKCVTFNLQGGEGFSRLR